MKNPHPSQTTHLRAPGQPLIKKMALNKMFLEFNFRRGSILSKMPNSKNVI
jgi:hypothetical protein